MEDYSGRIQIRYRDQSQKETERVISHLHFIDTLKLEAHCEHAVDSRIFRTDRILSAFSIDRNREVSFDYLSVLIACFSQNCPISQDKGSFVLFKGQRSKEKRELARRFHYPVIFEQRMRDLYQLFGNRCFKCFGPESLVVDHHVALNNGGHFIPGNLVVLCKRCNDSKGDLPPEHFYSAEEISSVEDFLASECDLFQFSFDWEQWNQSPEGYLRSIGLADDLVKEALNNPDSKWYIQRWNILTSSST